MTAPVSEHNVSVCLYLRSSVDLMWPPVLPVTFKCNHRKPSQVKDITPGGGGGGEGGGVSVRRFRGLFLFCSMWFVYFCTGKTFSL